MFAFIFRIGHEYGAAFSYENLISASKTNGILTFFHKRFFRLFVINPSICFWNIKSAKALIKDDMTLPWDMGCCYVLEYISSFRKRILKLQCPGDDFLNLEKEDKTFIWSIGNNSHHNAASSSVTSLSTLQTPLADGCLLLLLEDYHCHFQHYGIPPYSGYD